MSNYFDLPSEGELELAHHGILGQKWGIRRYQNSDGSLTAAGRARYGSEENLRKIQDARADAAAYKIRTKAKLKAQKKENKEIERMRKKAQKKYEKQQMKEYEKYSKKQQKIDEKYNRSNDNNGFAKQLVKEFARDAIWPNVKFTGKKIIANYMDNAFSTPTEKQMKQWKKETEKWETQHRRNQAKINAEYSNWMADDKKQKSWDDISDMSWKELNDYNGRMNKYSNIQKIRYGQGSGGGKNNKKH